MLGPGPNKTRVEVLRSVKGFCYIEKSCCEYEDLPYIVYNNFIINERKLSFKMLASRNKILYNQSARYKRVAPTNQDQDSRQGGDPS